MKSANLSGYLARFTGALALTSLSYNPSGYSYVHWLQSDAGGIPLKVLIGAILLIGFGIYLGASFKSIGTLGMLVVLVFLGVLAWTLWSYGWLALHSHSAIAWLGLLIGSATLAVGLYWATIWKTLTGQVSVQDTNDLESV